MVGEVTSPKLDTLPREIILMILSHLSSEDLVRNVRPTCRLFHGLLMNSYLWLNRIQELGLEFGPCRSNSNDFHIIRCCVYLEEQRKRWSNERLKQYINVEGHHATVDAIRFFTSSSNQRFCLSGSRDRSLILWDIEKIAKPNDDNARQVARCEGAHRGWIWSISTSDEDIFYSSGWDRCVKRWQITETGIEGTDSAACTGTVLRVLCDGVEVFYSTYDRKVGLMDARLGLTCIAEVEFHKNPVLDLAHLPSNPYIYSCGEDCRVLCIDKRVWKVVRSLNLPAFSRTLSLDDQNLLCGTANGKMIMLDTRDFSSIGEVAISPLCQIVQVQLTPVSQVCITRKRDFRMYTTGMRPYLFAESNDFDKELARFDLYNGDLAITCGDGSIMFWLQ